MRLGEAQRWAIAADRVAEQGRGHTGEHVRHHHVDEDRGPPPVERRDDCDQDPDRALRADAREPDEDVVEDADPVMDDPALESSIGTDQAGTSCFVDSISCCGLNGFPMKPWAPRDAAVRSESSSTFPLNMITGIEPTPWRS